MLRCLQETRIKRSCTRSSGDSDQRIKFFYQGKSEGTKGFALAINRPLVGKIMMKKDDLE